MDDPVSSIVLGLSSTIFGGILEGASDRKFSDGLKEFQENLRLHQPDINHNIARAIYRSYQQATLQTCAFYGEQLGVNMQQCVLQESFQGAVTTMIKTSRALEYITARVKLSGQQILKALQDSTSSDFIQLMPVPTAEERLAVEIRWLDRIAAVTRQKIKDLDSGQFDFLTFDFTHQPEYLVQPEYPSAADRAKAIRVELLQRVHREIAAAFGDTPEAFVRLLTDGWVNDAGQQQDWFTLFCACFQFQLKQDHQARDAFQNNLLAQLKIDGQAVSFDAAKLQMEKLGGDLCAKLDQARDVLLSRFDETDKRFDDLLPLVALTRDLQNTVQQLPQLILEEGVKTRDAIERKGDEVIAASKVHYEKLLAEFEQRLSAKIVRPVLQSLINLPNLTLTIVDREAEIAALQKELQNPAGRRVLPIVMPSGYGKTSLVTKFLRECINGQQIIVPNVAAIVFVRCRENASLADLLTDFDSIAGTQELQQLYIATTNARGSLPRFARNVLAYLSQIGKVWIVLDNFESWLDQEQRISNEELRVWLETALDTNHNVRLILTSQFMPQLSSSRLQNRLKQLPDIEEPLEKGLPENDALAFLRQEGNECGLDRAEEARLKEFLRGTHYVPSAMESLIGYLNDVYPDITFEKLMRDEKLKAAFHTHDREAGGQHLIQLQLAALSPDARRSLSVLAVLGSDTPREALIPLKLDGEFPVVLNRLYKSRLIRFQQDSFGVTRYTVQPYIAQNRDSSDEGLLSSEYADDLIRLGNQAGEAANHRLDRDLQKCAETIYRTQIGEGRFELRNDLAGAVMNKGVALSDLNDLSGALTCYDEAIEIYRTLIGEGRSELRNDLAGAVMNKGTALSDLNDLSGALTCYDEAIAIRRTLIGEGRSELRNDLAAALANKGLALQTQEDYPAAYSHLNEAVTLVEACVQVDGQHQFAGLLAQMTGWRDAVKNLMDEAE